MPDRVPKTGKGKLGARENLTADRDTGPCQGRIGTIRMKWGRVMKIVCVVHDEERIVDVTREADRYTVREWEGGCRQEIRLSESEASRIVQVIMELQQERRLGDKAEQIGGIHLEPMGVVGLER